MYAWPGTSKSSVTAWGTFHSFATHKRSEVDTKETRNSGRTRETFRAKRERERQRSADTYDSGADLQRRHLLVALLGLLRLRLTVAHHRLQLDVGEFLRFHGLRLQLVHGQAARNAGGGRRRRPALPIVRQYAGQHGQRQLVGLLVVAGRKRLDGQMRNGGGQLGDGHFDERRQRQRLLDDLQARDRIGSEHRHAHIHGIRTEVSAVTR